MPQHLMACFSRSFCEDEDDDNIDGYHRLESDGAPSDAAPLKIDEGTPEGESLESSGDSYQDGGPKKGYDKVDDKGKRLHGKLKRKEIKKLIRRYIRTTFKLMRRGMSMMSAGISPGFLFGPPATVRVNTDGKPPNSSDKFQMFI